MGGASIGGLFYPDSMTDIACFLRLSEIDIIPRLTQATQAIVKETISSRKNTSPQNVYEISQLYAAGALKVACVGLQCVGFNNAMYKALLDQAGTFSQSKWKGPSVAAALVPVTIGLGTGSAWNASSGVGGIVGGLGTMSLGHSGVDRNENIPIREGRRSR